MQDAPAGLLLQPRGVRAERVFLQGRKRGPEGRPQDVVPDGGQFERVAAPRRDAGGQGGARAFRAAQDDEQRHGEAEQEREDVPEFLGDVLRAVQREDDAVARTGEGAPEADEVRVRVGGLDEQAVEQIPEVGRGVQQGLRERRLEETPFVVHVDLQQQPRAALQAVADEGAPPAAAAPGQAEQLRFLLGAAQDPREGRAALGPREVQVGVHRNDVTCELQADGVGAGTDEGGVTALSSRDEARVHAAQGVLDLLDDAGALTFEPGLEGAGAEVLQAAQGQPAQPGQPGPGVRGGGVLLIPQEVREVGVRVEFQDGGTVGEEVEAVLPQAGQFDAQVAERVVAVPQQVREVFAVMTCTFQREVGQQRLSLRREHKLVLPLHDVHVTEQMHFDHSVPF